MSETPSAEAMDTSGHLKERAAIVEGVHFYYEERFIVFTSQFLLERGYCCGNGCRHCPYTEDPCPPVSEA
jgi:hypothetical protein